MTWKKIISDPYKTEWLNPRTRLRVQVFRSPGGPKLLIYNKYYERDPKDVPGYAYHKKFSSIRKALAAAHGFMRRKVQTLKSLKAEEDASTQKIINYFKSLLDRFFTTTANFAKIGPGHYMRGTEELFADVRLEGSLSSIYLYIWGKKSKKNPTKLLLGFASLNNSVEKFKKNEAYYLEQIDEIAKKRWVLEMAIDTIKDYLAPKHDFMGRTTRAGNKVFGKTRHDFLLEDTKRRKRK